MVRTGRVGVPTLSVVPISQHVSLGTWGNLELAGASGVLRPALGLDFELPEDVGRDLTAGVLLLNDDLGRLLFLPYAGERVFAYDLGSAAALAHIELPRNPDYGLRMATFLVVPGIGAAHLTESTLSVFREDCSLAWRKDDDFRGWIIDGRTTHELHLRAGDWTGGVSRQSRDLLDGRRLIDGPDNDHGA